MLKEQKFVLCIVAILGILLATPTPAAALDIEGIYMTSCKDHLDGTASPTPWGFEIWFGFVDSGSLDHIDVTTPAGGVTPFTISEDYGYWEYDSPTSYPSLGGLQADYPTGIYTLDFHSSSHALLNSIALNYSGLSEPDDFVHITSPLHGATDVSINPTFTWTIDPTDGDALGIWLWDPFTDDDVYENVPAPMTTLSWTPGVLDPAHEYDLEVSVFRVKDGVPGPALPTMTVNDDTFTYALLTEYLNEIEFTTVPEPATVALLGLGSLVLIRRKRRT